MPQAFAGLWPDEVAALQTLGKKAETIPVPPEQFDQITAATAKDEDVTGNQERTSAFGCLSPRQSLSKSEEIVANLDSLVGGATAAEIATDLNPLLVAHPSSRKGGFASFWNTPDGQALRGCPRVG